jgi:hypothetical protein
MLSVKKLVHHLHADGMKRPEAGGVQGLRQNQPAQVVRKVANHHPTHCRERKTHQ